MDNAIPRAPLPLLFTDADASYIDTSVAAASTISGRRRLRINQHPSCELQLRQRSAIAGSHSACDPCDRAPVKRHAHSQNDRSSNIIRTPRPTRSRAVTMPRQATFFRNRR